MINRAKRSKTANEVKTVENINKNPPQSLHKITSVQNSHKRQGDTESFLITGKSPLTENLPIN